MSNLGEYVKLKGEYFEPRESHISFSYLDRFIIVHGGIMESNTKQPIVVIDTREHYCFTLPKSRVTGYVPPVLESHSVAQTGSNYYIYGGMSKKLF